MHRQYHPQPQPATRRWQVLRTLAAHVAGAAEPSPGGAAPAPFPSPPEPVPALAAAMTNTEIKRRFAADGFIHLRGFFSPGEVAPRQVVEAQRHDHCHDHCVPELERSDRTANAQVAQMERELRRFIDAVLPESAVGRYYHDSADPSSLFQIDTMHDEPYFDQLMNGPRGASRVGDVVELLFGQRASGAVHFFNRIPGEDGAHDTPPHQDAAYSSQVCTAWVAVDPADTGNGCMRYSRGSHVRGAAVWEGEGGEMNGSRPHPGGAGVPGFGAALHRSDYTAADQQQEVAMIAGPGDLIIHHPHTVHRADGNRSADRNRRAVGCSYFGPAQQDEWMRINANMHSNAVVSGKDVAEGKATSPNGDR